MPAPPSNLRHSTVREDLASSHRPAVVGRQKERYVSDVVRLTYPSERRLLNQARAHGVPPARSLQGPEQTGRRSGSGRKNVHANSRAPLKSSVQLRARLRSAALLAL